MFYCIKKIERAFELPNVPNTIMLGILPKNIFKFFQVNHFESPSPVPGQNRSSCRLFLLPGCSARPLNISNRNQLAGISLPGYRFLIPWTGYPFRELWCQAGVLSALVSMRFNLLKYQI